MSDSIEALGSDGTRLRLEFEWVSDRFRHSISLCQPSGECAILLESIEGQANDDWPPSPPLQSLSIETRADGRQVALLVGMAGKSHWSLSVEAVAGQAALLFDFACRHSASPTWLGSQYRQIQPPAFDYIHCIDAELVSGRDEPLVAIKPRQCALSGTTRWKYQIERLSFPAPSPTDEP